MSARCQTPISSRGPCNTRLTITTNGLGRTVTQCHRCAWRHAGRCWQCGAPRTNHLQFGVYCEPCRKAVAKEANAYKRRTDESKAKASAYWKARREDPAFVERRRLYLRDWKAKNPDKVKANWARYAAKRDQQRANA